MVRIDEIARCEGFPCAGVRHEGFRVPGVSLDPDRVRLVMVSEGAAPDPADDFYAGPEAAYLRDTIEAFRLAGERVEGLEDLEALGVYVTTAVKCAKIGYAVPGAAIAQCAALLQAELALFARARAWLCMGDVAIKAVNAVARRAGAPRIVPAGSTYKLRGGCFTFGDVRVFPSYLQVGPNLQIEKGKRRVIAEDIAAALAWASR